MAVEGSCHGWLSHVGGVLFTRSVFDDSVFNYTSRPRGCWLHDGRFGVRRACCCCERCCRHLIDPRLPLEKGAAHREGPVAVVVLSQTLKMREHGKDPEAQCAVLRTPFTRRGVHRGHASSRRSALPPSVPGAAAHSRKREAHRAQAGARRRASGTSTEVRNGHALFGSGIP